jgi:hypothetical protein
MVRATTIILLLASLSPMPAFADEVFAATPSGQPDAVFVGDAKATAGAIANMCMDHRMSVISSTDSQVVCEVPLSMGKAMLTQLLIGNSYSTPPREFVRITVAPIGDHSRAQANAWVETQMAFGQMRQMPVSGASAINFMEDLLLAAGGALPSGTVFPNHAYLGAKYSITGMCGDEMILHVESLEEGGPAQRAGVLPNDCIISVGGKKVKSQGQMGDALARVSRLPSFTFGVRRGKEDMSFEIKTEMRPPIR